MLAVVQRLKQIYVDEDNFSFCPALIVVFFATNDGSLYSGHAASELKSANVIPQFKSALSPNWRQIESVIWRQNSRFRFDDAR